MVGRAAGQSKKTPDPFFSSAARPKLQLRPNVCPPAFNSFLVPLDGAFDRHLRRPAQFSQQSTDMIFVVAHTEFFFDNSGDAGAGPNFAAKPISLRSVPEKLWNQILLGRRQLRRMARRGLGTQRFGPTFAGPRKPAADRFLRDTKGFSNVTLIPAVLLQVQRPQPPPLAPVVRGEARPFHSVIILRPRNLTSFAQRSVDLGRAARGSD